MRNAVKSEELNEQAYEVRERVASNLSALLKQERWSHRAAAAALGLTPRYVNSRANGSIDLSAPDLVMFAEFLKVPVSRFFAEPTDGNVTSMVGRSRKTVRPEGLEPPTLSV